MAPRATLAALLLALTSAAPAQAERAFLGLASGDVQHRPADAPSWAAARIDRTVGPGDALRTGAGSHAKLVFGDSLLVLVGENTELRIPKGPEDAWDVEQLRGRVRFLAMTGTRLDPGVRVALPQELFVHAWEIEFEILGMDEPQDGERPWRVCGQSGGLEIRGGFGVIEPKNDRCVDVGVTASEPYEPPEDPPDSTIPPFVGAGPELPPISSPPPSPSDPDMLDDPDRVLPDPDELEPELELDVDEADTPRGPRP